MLDAVGHNRRARRARTVALAMLLASCAAPGCRSAHDAALPVYQDAFLQPHTLAALDSARAPMHRIADFAFTDQNGAPLTTAQLRGHIHVAQFFFAHCTTMCPPLFDAMAQVREAYPDDPAVRLVSFTLTPETDSVAALKRFAATRHLPAHGWSLLTGDHDAIRTLAARSYFVGVGGVGDSTQHAGNLVLVDPELRVRGVYAVTRASETRRLIDDIATLQREAHAR